jgi:hypothetical protein
VIKRSARSQGAGELLMSHGRHLCFGNRDLRYGDAGTISISYESTVVLVLYSLS